MKRIVIISIALIILIQLIPIDRNNPTTDESSEIKLDGEVKMIIQTACYDCHSNNTKWPWYSYVAPVSWLIANDVSDGRDEINFSLWNTYSQKRIDRKFREIAEQIEKEEMPLPIYLLMHSEANLDKSQRKVLINWANKNLEMLQPDSLKQQD
jgi:Haem-binding domain